tara:strand:- start:12 stop:191 length:180 start_codon:yes stop_codon:yes gene_type:complete
MEFRDPQEAFEEAIRECLLSDKKGDIAPYAGDYMYMGTERGVDLFKNKDTRRYLRPTKS